MGVSAFEYVESLLPHCRQVQVAQQTALRCVAQSAVGTRQSAVRRGGRRPSPSPAVVVLHAALYRLQSVSAFRYCTHTVHVHTAFYATALPCLNTACASLSTRSTRRRTISTSAPGTTRDTHTRRFLGLRYALVFAARGVGWHATWDTCPRACCAGAAKVPLAGAPERLSEGRWGGPLAGHMAGQASCTACLHACAPRVEGEMEIFKSRNQLQSATRRKVTMLL